MSVRRLGYACMRSATKEPTVRTCRLKNASPSRLTELVETNLETLREILEFNAARDIRLFRISSDTIPFASHAEVSFNWRDQFSEKLCDLGKLARKHDIRLSMHPGQYTVLNSPHEDVLSNSLADLKYHVRFLDALNCPPKAKVITHIGGVYGEKEAAKQRFIERANELPEAVRDRLVIENDEQSYNIREVLAIGEATGLPVIFDYLHHQLNPPEEKQELTTWIKEAFRSWSEAEGPPKVHFSTPSGEAGGQHAEFIDSDVFREFQRTTAELPLFDVMLECKRKEEALLQLREELAK